MSIPINGLLPSQFTARLHEASKNITKMALKDIQATENRDYLLLNTDGMQVNLQRNYLNQHIVDFLLKLATEKQLTKKINDLFAGHCVNSTENQPALHSVLRAPAGDFLLVNEVNVVQQVQQVLQRMKVLTNQLHDQQLLGSTSKIISDVVHIGIGGSFLGPKLLHEALAAYHNNHINVYFVSELDSQDIRSVLGSLDPEKTLFITASKSFTTQETLQNSVTALEWLKQTLSAQEQSIIRKHFIAVTANTSKAQEFGIAEDNIFPIWEWVGGRYSVWSAMSLPVMLATSVDCFDKFLAGGYAMDQHFQVTPLAKNIPVMLALVGIWYINFFHCQTQAIIPYNFTLRSLPAFLQQLEMESNGKAVNKQGKRIDYATVPVIWGQTGIHGQHAYYQMLHQGRQFIPIDFVFFKDKSVSVHRQELMVANLLAHANVLIDGNIEQLAKQNALMHQILFGSRVSTMILLNDLSPYNLGQLLALYEHKVYVQSVIWDINPFDQWGVKSGKNLARQWQNIFSQQPDSLDRVTQQSIDYLNT